MSGDEKHGTNGALAMSGVLLIGISGGSCSGKTTLARHLNTALGSAQCSVLLQDDYYRHNANGWAPDSLPNFDHPDAVDFDLLADHLRNLREGQPVLSPIYDFVTHTRTSRQSRIEPRPIVLLDGILILCHADIRAVLDLSVFIQCDAPTRLARRLSRDIVERGRTRESVLTQFQEQVEPMHQAFVEPSSRYADLVFDNVANVSMPDQWCQTVLQAIELRRQSIG
ncbi:MAG: uridine kinase [Pseudomonadota bacterium]